ncbi:cysteine-rich hydrophobic domain-containing protein 1-like [Hydractinia symbiolongicarpus]|uniref:cysteine-rich hydrophobic domain-containing protein 1-like n=1 Tax=Hydractinia symbiolongicarpus TaxID=13093 RepID=UPI00254FF9CC|nr:cysteine-rich hydrophobic domain-containing protein 1-like [Hydractinia symbiolongicarpus]
MRVVFLLAFCCLIGITFSYRHGKRELTEDIKNEKEAEEKLKAILSKEDDEDDEDDGEEIDVPEDEDSEDRQMHDPRPWRFRGRKFMRRWAPVIIRTYPAWGGKK